MSDFRYRSSNNSDKASDKNNQDSDGNDQDSDESDQDDYEIKGLENCNLRRVISLFVRFIFKFCAWNERMCFSFSNHCPCFMLPNCIGTPENISPPVLNKNIQSILSTSRYRDNQNSVQKQVRTTKLPSIFHHSTRDYLMYRSLSIITSLIYIPICLW